MYLDAAPVIYTVEQVAPYASAVDAHLSGPGVVHVASDLTRLECRVRPFRDGNLALLHDFDDYFAGTVAELVALSRAVLDRATEIRVYHGFKDSRRDPRCRGPGFRLRRIPYERSPLGQVRRTGGCRRSAVRYGPRNGTRPVGLSVRAASGVLMQHGSRPVSAVTRNRHNGLSFSAACLTMVRQ
jgi:hypothetical protein